MSEQQPDKIGKYEIVRTLGKGAMGVVYEGLDRDIERRVAVKTLHPHLLTEADGQEFIERFKREAKAAARCMHPNIVMVMEYGQDGNTPFIAMEYVEGTALNDLLKADKSFSLKQIFNIISQILKALHTAHKHGIVHRDIKPANVMVLKNGVVKLADFGIARLENSGELTQVGVLVGTPRFMAPEQTFGLDVDHRADLFSVSMLFLELLGKLPEGLPYPMCRLPEIVGLPPNNRINYTIPIPSALIDVLHSGLAVRVEDRFADAKSFALAIKQVIPQLKTGQANLNQGSSELSAPEADNREDLDAMEQMLASYIGPLAKTLIGYKAKQHKGDLDTLAESLAMEIPNGNEREQFLTRWSNRGLEFNSMSSLGSKPSSNNYNDMLRTHIGDQPASQASNETTIDEGTLTQLRDDYASYVGPMAARLIKHHTSASISIAELVATLANDIPNEKEREQFIAQWQR